MITYFIPLVLSGSQSSPPDLLLRARSATHLVQLSEEQIQWQYCDAIVENSGKAFFARIPGPEVEKFANNGNRSFRGERLFFGLEGPGPQIYSRTYSQNRYWSPKPSKLGSAWGNSSELIGVAGPSSLLLETQFGYDSKNRRFAGVSEVRFDKRGREANIDLMFPTDRSGSYDIVHTTIGKNEVWLLVAHQLGNSYKTRLEAYMMKGRKLTKSPGPYGKLAGRTIAVRKSLRGKPMKVGDVDPIGLKVFLFEGLEWVEVDLLRRSEIKGTFAAKDRPSPYQVTYVRGEAYGSANADALYKLDRNLREWIKIGPYKIIGTSASEQFMLVRHTVGGALWMLDLGPAK